MKIASVLIALMFIAFGALQYNDPDPFLWMAIYFFTAVLAILRIFNRSVLVLNLPLAIVCIVDGIVLTPALQENYFDLEEAREAFGVYIVALWLLIQYLMLRSADQ